MAGSKGLTNDDSGLMPSTYLAVLSLVAQGLRYGYEIDRALNERGFREWVDIRMSSVYKALGELEKQGLVKGSKKDVSLRPSMKVYGLTGKGRRELQKQVLICLSDPPKTNTVFDLGMSAIWSVTREEALGALMDFRERLKERIRFLEDNLRSIDGLEHLKTEEQLRLIGRRPVLQMKDIRYIPIIRTLFKRPLVAVRSQYDWVDQLVRSIQSNEDGLPFRNPTR